MAERGNEQKNFFKNLHTDQYKWNDFFLIPLIVTIVMMFVANNISTIFHLPGSLDYSFTLLLLYPKKQTNN